MPRSSVVIAISPHNSAARRREQENGTVLAPFLRAAWMHDFARSFSALPGVTFGGTGIATVSDAAVAHLGIQYNLSANLSLLASVDAEVSSAYRRIGATANLRYAW